VNGLLVPPGTVDPLVKALGRLADDKDLRSKLGKEGRVTVEAEFSLPDCARRVGELLGVVTGPG
jgi:glycosyltransferase involved in cell wall biosynthesis